LVVGQFQSERRFFSYDEKHDPRSHTKLHEKGACFVTLSVTSWIVYRWSEPENFKMTHYRTLRRYAK